MMPAENAMVIMTVHQHPLASQCIILMIFFVISSLGAENVNISIVK